MIEAGISKESMHEFDVVPGNAEGMPIGRDAWNIFGDAIDA